MPVAWARACVISLYIGKSDEYVFIYVLVLGFKNF